MKAKRKEIVHTRQMKEKELIKLRELPCLPPTGSDGQRLKPPFRLPQRQKRK